MIVTLKQEIRSMLWKPISWQIEKVSELRAVQWHIQTIKVQTREKKSMHFDLKKFMLQKLSFAKLWNKRKPVLTDKKVCGS